MIMWKVQMKKIGILILSSLFCQTLSAVEVSNNSFGNRMSVFPYGCEVNTQNTFQRDDKGSLDQQSLFNKTRCGVVSIKVCVALHRVQGAKQWSGTGFLVDKDKGLIVTNAHVAGELTACSYEIKFGNGKSVEASLMYIDPCYDFAVLYVNPADIPSYATPLTISDEPLSINTEVYSMGNSANNEFSTYKGYVFDTEGILWLKPIAEQSFQFSGLTVPGASGSPVLNAKGEVVGLLYGGKLVSGAALPISYVAPVIKALRDNKKFHRYFYGFIADYGSVQDFVSAGEIPESALSEYERAFPDKDKILYVSKKLAAFNSESSALEPGDVIWEIDGELIGPRLSRIDDLVQQKEGKSLQLTVYRSGKKVKLEIPTFDLSSLRKMKLLSFAGTVFIETPIEFKVCLGIRTNGVYILDCESGSAFFDVFALSDSAGVNAGAQIVSIDGKDISSIDDVVDVIPGLFRKKVFNVRFVRLCGDSQVSSITAKHTPEFAEATLYTFDQDSRSWSVKSIKNPKQNG